jgi:lipopolysaccharide/colanic/teichoic acid biosynthesis glycosyltransferase
MNFFFIFIYLILILKIIYIIILSRYFYLYYKSKSNRNPSNYLYDYKLKKINKTLSILEKILQIILTLFLIILFNPFFSSTNKLLNYEAPKELLFTTGVVLLFKEIKDDFFY